LAARIPPSFPPPFLVDRVRELGYGTGPWIREQLVQRWGAPMADKFILEGKAEGWIVSPNRGTYFVPSAQDLMVVGWLPEPDRDEFLTSRYLFARGVRFWCVSAWTRERGLELGGPLFVTDLRARGTKEDASPAGTDRKRLQAELVARSAVVSSLPFLESVVIVPRLPAQTDRPQAQVALMPEDVKASARRVNQEVIAGVIGMILEAATKQSPAQTELKALLDGGKRARAIPYTLGPDVDDSAWVVAFLASLGIPRVEEFLAQLLRRKDFTVNKDTVQRWASLIGPPQPNENWPDVIRQGPFPFLLVPKMLWSAMGADQASRRYRILDRLGAA